MKQFRIIILIFFVVCIFPPVNNACASSVQDELKVTLDQILKILQDKSLKGEDATEKRRTSLRKLIHDKFSFDKMSQLSLAKHWKARSDEEKKTFIDLFGQLLEQTYISKIESYSNEKVIFLKEYVTDKKAQVDTKVITETIEIPIDYRLYQTNNGSWMVYDVIIEGVSLVGNYRSQFDQMLQKNSFEKLIEDLKNKIKA
ncbi:MAG: ABC transporter substrate-binding protein [Desulfobacula sp.]|jgi:phospholipid transport system substrate-binding protein|uniref:Tgt2/MlaC family protein n=1 Tax=Desulfobacula sp. TaxID=2593537 RepID=UPI001DE88E7C|nr:ABC transporter substrate-binding protein [Desulfobacula sp.]MBT3486907.1 ABC transporter substrate-binding protein [Desulfobacula sp.]MBT3805617.1 ABC transporter substrate-binding protein [Desulfobacula sp.]MBT4026489.1 ABC transporter substrate-binding protein [Desulfobacula sp.]MBT4199620.1 ABC transporter substrate-binding protein [Desulfobacula sp.]